MRARRPRSQGGARRPGAIRAPDDGRTEWFAGGAVAPPGFPGGGLTGAGKLGSQDRDAELLASECIVGR